MNFKDLKQLCLSHGFTNVVPLACDTIELKPEVRQMCASDSCHKYNKCWSCPPDCGTLEECEQRVRRYKTGNPGTDSGRAGGFPGRGRHDAHRSYAQSLLLQPGKRSAEILPEYASHRRRLLHKMQNLYLSGRSLPLSGPGLFLYGSLWNAGYAGLSGKPP